MGIIKLTNSSILADSVLLEPIGIIGKLDINSDVTFNEIDTIRYSTYEPQVSTVHIPQLETDNAYDYFNKLTDTVKTLNIQSQEYYNNINYSATQLLNKYNNVNSPDGSITLLDLLNIIRTTYVALNDTIFYNDGVYKKLIFDDAEQITLAMGQIKMLGDTLMEVESGITIRIDQVRAYVDQTFTNAEGQLHTLNQLIIDTQGITLSAIQDKLNAYGNYVYKNYASLKVFNDRITTLVGREDFNDLGVLVNRNTSSITQLATEIALKVSSEEFNNLGELVDLSTADIVMLKDSITSKVSTQAFEEFQIGANTYFDIIADHESRITQLPDLIELSVKTSYIDGLIADLTELDGKNSSLTTALTGMGVDMADLVTKYNSMDLGLKDLQTTTINDHIIILAQGSSISALETGLSLNATRLSVDTLTGRVTTNETAIVASATKIGLLVSENNVILAGVIVDAINNGTVTIAANKINIDGTTTFSSGYDPANKNTVFRSQPKPPYKEGDTWIKDSEYYTSSATRLEGGFVLADWYKSTKYTDDSVANGMSATYRDGTDPAYNWLTDIDKDNHVNDHWIATDLTVTDKGPVTKIYTKTINAGVTTYAWQLDQTYIDGGRIITNELLAQNIYASGATIGGFTIGKDVNNSEYMRTSNQYLPNPTVGQSGIWMGFTEGTPKFFIGNSDEYITFNGTNLIISGYTRLGNNEDSISFSDLALFNKYFKIVNPDMENEYIQVVSNFCATGEVSSYRGGIDVFPPHIWDSIPVAGQGAAQNLGVIRIGTSLTIDEYGVVNVSGSVGNQTLGFTGTTLSISGGNSVSLAALSPSWTNITSKPTTLSGYGITDAISRIAIDNASQETVAYSGFFRSNTSPLAYYINLQHPSNTGYTIQIGNSYTDSLGFRTKVAGVFNDYHILWHDGNFTPSNYSLTTHSHITTNITEGTNLYYTDSRARIACANSGTVYDSARLNNVLASFYTRRDVAETIAQSWIFNNTVTAGSLVVAKATGAEGSVIVQSGTSSARLFYRDTDSNTGIYIVDSGGAGTRLRFMGTQGNVAIVENGVGNVVIGDLYNVATAKLHIVSNGNADGIKVESNSGGRCAAYLSNTSATGNGVILRGGTGTNYYIAQFRDYNNNAKVTIWGDGSSDWNSNITVNANNPVLTLNCSTSQAGYLLGTQAGVSKWYIGRGVAASDNVFFNNYASADLIFSTNSTERLRINGNGQIGLGRSATTYNVEVKGELGVGTWVNGIATIGASGGYAYYGCNGITNGISIDGSGVLRASTTHVNHLFINQTAGSGNGISLFGGSTVGQPSFGLMFATTANFGTHGFVTADWATYFTTNGATGRGWVFRDTALGNVLSVSNQGNVKASGIVSANYLAIGSVTNGEGTGISLYNNASDLITQNAKQFPVYGLFFGKTMYFGTYGGVTSDWATYFTMNDVANRGWIFKRGVTNITSIDTYGNITTAGEGAFLKSSDRDLKENIKAIDNAGNFLKKLVGVEYDWNEEAIRCNPNKANNRHHASFIAQEWEKVFPWATHTIYEKYKAIDDSIMIPYLTAGWNEHDIKIHNLEKDNLRLNKELQQLNDKLNLIILK